MPIIVVLMIDAAKGVDEDVERILGKLAGLKAPLILALNKIDRVKKERLLELAGHCNARAAFTRHLHDLGAQRRRRRRSQGASGRAVAARALALSRRTRSRTRRCA